MKEYIEREALLVKLEQIAREPDYQHDGEDWLNGVIIAQEEVIVAPAADVVECKRGEWIDDTFCSNCHWFGEDAEGHIIMSDHNFCPNCGADMRSHQNILCDQTEEVEPCGE